MKRPTVAQEPLTPPYPAVGGRIVTGRMSADLALAGAWLVALVASLAVLFIGEVLNQTPCVLCWFQRAFMFPLAVVLGFGLWWRDAAVGRYGIVLALGGGAVALWHLGLLAGIVPEEVRPCTATGPSCTDENQEIGGVPIPLLSLAAFAAIAVLSTLSLRGRQP